MEILEGLDYMFPNAKCELIYHNAFELLIAVLLSAQTTDKNVNSVTPTLFSKYPDCYKMADAKISDVEMVIKKIGLYHNKAKNVINCSKMLVKEYGGIIPNKKEELIKLPGVGTKTANVVLGEIYNIPTIAVDTHVNRVAKRLNIALENDSLEAVETKLMNFVPKEKWVKFHHQMIHFGRYICQARKPICEKCLIKDHCKGQ